MQRIILFLLVGFFTTTFPAVGQTPQMPTVAVLDLYGPGISQTQLSQLTSRLRQEFFTTAQYRAVDNFRSGRSITIAQGAMSSCTDSCFITGHYPLICRRIAERLGVDKLVIGMIDLQNERIRVRLVDAETGEVEVHVSENCRHTYGFMETRMMPYIAARLTGAAQSVPPSEAFPVSLQYSGNPPPATPGRKAGEIAAGTGGALLGFVVGSLLGLAASPGCSPFTDDDETNCNAGIVICPLLGTVLGTSGMVCGIGQEREVTGSFAQTCLGGLLGTVVGVTGVIASKGSPGGVFIGMAMPALGATVAFNLSRRYRTTGYRFPPAYVPGQSNEFTTGGQQHTGTVYIDLFRVSF